MTYTPSLRELDSSEADAVNGGIDPITGAIITGIVAGVVIAACEEPIQGFVDGLFAGFNNGR